MGPPTIWRGIYHYMYGRHVRVCLALRTEALTDILFFLLQIINFKNLKKIYVKDINVPKNSECDLKSITTNFKNNCLKNNLISFLA